MVKSEKKPKSKKKKILISVLIIFASVVLVAAAVCVWQWENINSFILSISYNDAQILEKMKANDNELKKEVEKYFPNGIRDFTEQEKELISAGKVSEKQVLAKILIEAEEAASVGTSEVVEDFTKKQQLENPQTTVTYNPETVVTPTKKSEAKGDHSANKPKEETHLVVIGRPSTPATAETSKTKEPSKPTQESIISKYVSKLYALEGKYLSAIEGVVASAKSAAKSKGLTKKDTSQLLAIGANYMGVINSLEASCDAEVEGIISQLTSELKSINGDTSIISTIRSAYSSEKSLKRAYYMNMVY